MQVSRGAPAGGTRGAAQGLRAVAVLTVIAAHAGVPFLLGALGLADMGRQRRSAGSIVPDVDPALTVGDGATSPEPAQDRSERVA